MTGESMIRTILAAVDNSPRAVGVSRVAFDLARRYGATVHLFNAIGVPPELVAAAANVDDRLPAVLTAQSREMLLRLAQGHPEATIVEPEVLRGQPWRAILSAAERIGADLVVLGSHGYSGWDRVLGTTAAQVANHADRNVLVVHEGPKADA